MSVPLIMKLIVPQVRAAASLGRAATGVQQRSVRVWRRWRRRVEAEMRRRRQDGATAKRRRRCSSSAAEQRRRRCSAACRVRSGAGRTERGWRRSGLPSCLGDGETRERAYLRSTWRYLVRSMRDSISRDAISGD